MKALVLLLHAILIITSYTNAQKLIPLKNNALSLTGEWERVGNLEEGSIGKIIFYPDGTLNIINKKNTEVLVLRYRLLTDTNPLQGEIISTPFGLGQLKDRIAFTVNFSSSSNINFKYTSDTKSQTIFLKKVKDIPHGIIPLSR